VAVDLGKGRWPDLRRGKGEQRVYEGELVRATCKSFVLFGFGFIRAARMCRCTDVMERKMVDELQTTNQVVVVLMFTDTFSFFHPNPTLLIYFRFDSGRASV
jgi:hypothetical protein